MVKSVYGENQKHERIEGQTMEKFCTKCGKQLTEGMVFCSDCGTKVDAEIQMDPTPAPQPVPQPAPQPFVTPVPQPVFTQQASVAESNDNVVGTAAFFWLKLAFVIPVVGFILSIILSFAPKNKSLKNYAKSTLIWYILGIVAVGIFVLLSVFVFGSIAESYNNSYYYYY